MKKPIYLFLFQLLFCLSVAGQEVKPEVIASAGQSFKTTGSQVSWTLGEVVVETHQAGASVLTQGFQQPGTQVEVGYSDPVIQLSVNVYPVPATGYVTLDFQDTPENLAVELYSMKGELLQARPVLSHRLQFDLNGLPAAEYIIKIVSAEKTMIRSYIIIKQN